MVRDEIEWELGDEHIHSFAVVDETERRGL